MMDARWVRGVLRLRPAAVATATMLAIALSLTGVALSGDIPIATVPVGMSPAAVAVNPLTHAVYVANYYGDTVSIIDGVTDSNLTTITMPVGGAIGAVPIAVVVNPLSTPPRAYVANWQSHRISFIDESTFTKTATVTVPASNGAGNPRALALWATSSPPKLYVANYGRSSVSVLNAETGASLAEIPVGASPRSLAIFTSAGRKRLYVANRYSDNVSIIDMETDAVVATVPTGVAPKAMAVNQATGYVFVTSPASDLVTVIDDTDSVLANIPVGDNPLGIDIEEASGRVFVADYASNDVVVIDSATNSSVATIPVASQPWAVAVDQGDRKVFVTNYGASQVTIIDRDLAVTTCPVGANPYALAVDEGSTPHKTYCANWGSNTVTVIDQPVAVGRAIFGPQLAIAADPPAVGPVAAAVTPFPSNATTNPTPAIVGTASSTRSPYRTDIAAVFVRVDGPGSPLVRAEITLGAGTPDVEWRLVPASPLAIGNHQVSVVVFDDASASAVSSGLDQGGRSASPAGEASYSFSVVADTGSDQPVFEVAPVNRATACRKCHDDSLAGSHPYHNAIGNCGAVCHPGWGDSLLAAVPTYLGSAGAFASAASQNTTASMLHVIHASPRWQMSSDRANSKCGSCHAAAACEACHESGVDASHAGHSSTMTTNTPWVGDTSGGIIGGDMTIDSHRTGQSVMCGAPACHNTAGVANSTAGLLDDSSHTASAEYGYLENVVAKTPPGNWKTQYASVFTLGQEVRSNYLDSTLSLPFSGERISLVADKDPYRGIAEIKIDGVSKGTVDLYSDTTRHQVEVFASGKLAPGGHSMTIRVTDTRNSSARATYVTVDQFKVYTLEPGKIAPACSSCHP